MLSLIAGAFIYLHPVETIKVEQVESRYTVEQRIEKERQEKLRIEENRKAALTGAVVLVRRDNTNNCVMYARRVTGINRPLGYGGKRAIQGETPKVGAIGVVNRGRHAVVVKEITGNYITVEESNVVKGWITRRVLPKNNFLGFIYS
jgi:hypothetical protein